MITMKKVSNRPKDRSDMEMLREALKIMEQKMNKGLSYALEKEDIVNYMKFSDEEKLNWLEEIVSCTEMVLSPKEKKVRDISEMIGNCKK